MKYKCSILLSILLLETPVFKKSESAQKVWFWVHFKMITAMSDDEWFLFYR